MHIINACWATAGILVLLLSSVLDVRCSLLWQVLLTPERLRLVDHMPEVVKLLSFILERNPLQRPTADDVVAR